MVKHAIFWLNTFPQATGILSTQSPRTLITGLKVDSKRHARFEFGKYVQTHEPHNNSMTPRTTGALALRTTGNAQGSYYFLSLITGRLINRMYAT